MAKTILLLQFSLLLWRFHLAAGIRCSQKVQGNALVLVHENDRVYIRQSLLHGYMQTPRFCYVIVLESVHFLTATSNHKPPEDYLMFDVVCLNETSVYVKWHPLNEPLQQVHLEYQCFNTSSGMNVQVCEGSVHSLPSTFVTLLLSNRLLTPNFIGNRATGCH